MTDQQILDMYRPMVHFLAQVCGPASEVVLHDVSKPDASVIEIANGAMTGRKVGDPLTDLARKVMENSEYLEEDCWCNYSGAGKGRNFVSSTYYIKNRNRLIGMLCVNRDVSEAQELGRALERVMAQYVMAPNEQVAVRENLDNQVAEIRENMVSDAIAEMSVDPERMNREEKIRLVHQLRDRGLLDMKGAVAEIAKQLRVSVPTVYRYMNQSEE